MKYSLTNATKINRLHISNLTTQSFTFRLEIYMTMGGEQDPIKGKAIFETKDKAKFTSKTGDVLYFHIKHNKTEIEIQTDSNDIFVKYAKGKYKITNE